MQSRRKSFAHHDRLCKRASGKLFAMRARRRPTVMKQLAALALLLLAFGCATGYQSLDEGITGGYTETRLAPDEWRLLVEGNGLTERRQVEQILLRRAAELTLEQGKRYFVL